MLHAVQRHVLVVLSDRVLHFVQGRNGARLHGQRVGTEDSPDALLSKAIPGFKCADRVTVVLGNPWVSLDLVGIADGREQITDPQTLITLARTERRLTADKQPAMSWRPRCCRLKKHLLIGTIAENTLESVIQTLTTHHLSAASVQPLWSWLTTSRHPGFRTRRPWLAVLEPDFVTIAHQTRDEPDTLRTVRVSHDGPSLSELMSRQAAACGLAADAVETISLGAPAPTLTLPWSRDPADQQVLC